MANLVGGSVVGIGIDSVFHVASRAAGRVIKFRSALRQLKSMLEDLRLSFDRIVEYNQVMLNSPKAETEGFIGLLREGEKLVEDCSKVKWWNLYRMNLYSRKMEEQDGALRRFTQINIPAQTLRDVKFNQLVLVRHDEMLVGLDETLGEVKSNQLMMNKKVCEWVRRCEETSKFNELMTDKKLSELRDLMISNSHRRPRPARLHCAPRSHARRMKLKHPIIIN